MEISEEIKNLEKILQMHKVEREIRKEDGYGGWYSEPFYEKSYTYGFVKRTRAAGKLNRLLQSSESTKLPQEVRDRIKDEIHSSYTAGREDIITNIMGLVFIGGLGWVLYHFIWSKV